MKRSMKPPMYIWNTALPHSAARRYFLQRATIAPTPGPTPAPPAPPAPPPKPKPSVSPAPGDLPLAQAVSPAFPAFWVRLVLLTSVFGLPALALLNAHALTVTSGMVVLLEALVFCLCLLLLVQRIPPWT
ncbi:MAG: hypothetical protein ORN29_08425, partial [Rhodoferax sp.]|nr:hypothetical protein [Rhodoferax sp.]